MMPIQISSDETIEAAIAALPGGRVLDVATGDGWLLAWLLDTVQAPAGGVGVDLRPLDFAALDEASVFNRPDVEFAQMDAQTMDFEDGSFDTVAIASSLHHLADPQAVLRDMLRVLAPGGHLVIVEMYRDHQDGPQLTHIMMHHWWANIDSAHGITHNETFTRQGVLDLLEPLNLHDVQVFDAAFGADSDPHDAERRDVLLRRIDHYLQRAEDLPEREAFTARANEIKLRLLNEGFQTANMLVVVGQKPGG
jgi:SAM-dependent methyltransferase